MRREGRLPWRNATEGGPWVTGSIALGSSSRTGEGSSLAALVRTRPDLRLAALGIDPGLRDVMELIPEIVFLLRAREGKARLEYVSPACQDIDGYSPEQVLATDVLVEFMHPDDRKATMAVATGATTTIRFRHADGHWVSLDCRAR